MNVELCLFSYAGVDSHTISSLANELQQIRIATLPATDTPRIAFTQVSNDALISRSRSMALSRFFLSNRDVIVMVDRDIQWRPGDVYALAEKALKEDACIGGMYCQRARGLGLASRLEDESAAATIGMDRLYKAQFLGSGFLAIPRSAVTRVLEYFKPRPQDPAPNELRPCIYSDGSKFWPFFLPLIVDNRLPKEANPEGLAEYLSEDWAWSHRCTQAGVPLFLWSKPLLVHWGHHGFTAQESGRAIR